MIASTHRVEVVPVALEPHPNADSLSIVRVWGYTVVVRTDDWRDRTLGAYIVPDSVVDSTRPEFAFLAGKDRIRVRRFRGVMSQGLLVPAPEGAVAGDDVAATLGVRRWEPPIQASTAGEAEAPPPGWRPVYDVEALHRYPHVLAAGTPVVVTEKIHGTSGRWCWVDDRLWCGSRSEWKRADDAIVWWQVARQQPWIEALCRQLGPEATVYGEVYGAVQDLRYDLPRGAYGVAVFDVLRAGSWLPWGDMATTVEAAGGTTVPVLWTGPFDFAAVIALAEGQSRLAAHVREGIVVRPEAERTHPEIGRVILKAVGNGYLERGG